VIIKKLVVGPIMANCYILGCQDTREAVVIDPGDESERIVMLLAEEKLKLKYIINTHGHFDHVGGNRELKAATEADILIHALDEPMLGQLANAARGFGLDGVENSPPADRTIDEGDEITFGNITLKVIHMPGHSQGGVALYTDSIVFVGDSLFAGSIGRTDLPGGDYHTLISSIKDKLFQLPDETVVYTGHGPQTSIKQEKITNPFVGYNS
jgi:glyoxylase-like metal-dependent hydrolase (beta-lactamase superfamily II)